MSRIKALRIFKGMTQKETAEMTGIPLRTYKNYENDASKVGTVKYNYIISELEKVERSRNGVLSLDEIKRSCSRVMAARSVEYCILFGSYAKENATPESDVDLLIAGDVKTSEFDGIRAEMMELLGKEVSLLDIKDAYGDAEALNDVLRFGKKVYVR